MEQGNWVRSSLATEHRGAVEVSVSEDAVCVRSAGSPGDEPGEVLRFTRAEWDEFVAGAKNGEFDR